MKDIYQELYDKSTYGSAKDDRCPGVRLYHRYKEWIIGPVMDVGCGSGDTVDYLNRSGIQAVGADWIEPKNKSCFKKDLYELVIDPVDYNTALCIDVFEHLEDKVIEHLLYEMKYLDRQIISVHIGSSVENGHELHINRKSFKSWHYLISKFVSIRREINIHAKQRLYLCQTK